MTILGHTIILAKRGDEIAEGSVLFCSLNFLSDFIGTHVQSLADADDLSQEALCIVSEKLPTFDELRDEGFDDWLAGIAWTLISRYQSNEYFCGRRTRTEIDGEPAHFSEKAFSSIGVDENDVCDDGSLIRLPEDGIRYSLAARAEMEEAERAFRGN